jgi:hypothetical protein
MSAINWENLDKFYLVLSAVLILLAAMVIFTFQGVFSAYIKAYEIGPNIDSELRVDKEILDSAYDFVFNKRIVSLELK